MIVHLIASAEKIKENIDTLRRIVQVIHAQGHSLAVDWVEPAYARALNNTSPASVDWKTVYRENMVAIRECDVIVAESTHRSFGTGYQVAVGAHLLEIPTLILRRDDVENDIMAVGLDDKNISFKTYSEEDLEPLLVEFLLYNGVLNIDRFNFVTDRRINNHLRWEAMKTGETKGEIVRKLILRDIENKRGDL